MEVHHQRWRGEGRSGGHKGEKGDNFGVLRVEGRKKMLKGEKGSILQGSEKSDPHAAVIPATTGRSSQSASMHLHKKPILPYHCNNLTNKKLCNQRLFVKKAKGLQIQTKRFEVRTPVCLGPIKSKYDDDDVDFAHTHATLANQIKLIPFQHQGQN
jgi:hypothetical protein